jgi:triosephosphate isomerase
MQGLKEFGCIKICFAYEPAAAIGSGKVANKQEIGAVMACVKQASAQLPDVDVRCLYGGSVDEFSIIELKKITSVGGFLIGRASTDFQKLEKIIF